MMRRAPVSGFSYIEMLISLALLSILTALVSGLFDFGRRAWEQSAEFETLSDEALLRADIRSWLEWASFRPTQFEALSVTAGLTGFRYRGGVAHPQFPLLDRLELVIETQSDGTLNAQFNVSSSLPVDDLTRSGPLGASLTDIEITYYGRRALGEPPTWGANWDQRNGPPRLISIAATRPGGRPWPPLIIYPRKQLLQSEISVSSPFPPG